MYGAQGSIFSGAPPAIGTPVSLGCALGSAGASSVTLTTTAAIPLGALVVAGVQVGFAATQTISSISDGANTYSAAVGATWDATGAFVTGLWQKANAAAVSTSASLTATFSAASSSGTNVPVICAAYVTGIQATTPLDKTASGKTEPGTAFASGSTGTLTQSNEIAFGFVGAYSNCTSVTEGSGFTTISPSPKLQGSGNQWCGNLASKTVAATTALNYQPTLTSSFGAALIGTFKGF
jgi:hypothetical protein